MSYQIARRDFIRQFNATYPDRVADIAVDFLRYATTLHRLAVAVCNGDYPADDGLRKTTACPKCERHWARDSMAACQPLDTPALRNSMNETRTLPLDKRYKPIFCKDCIVSHKAENLATVHGLIAITDGDPRGCALELYPAGTDRKDIESGRARHLGLFVPHSSR